MKIFTYATSPQGCQLGFVSQNMTTVKKLISNAPVLHYFDLTLPFTLQCHASEGGSNYALLQEGQSIAFGARGLTQMERNYRKGNAGHQLWL